MECVKKCKELREVRIELTFEDFDRKNLGLIDEIFEALRGKAKVIVVWRVMRCVSKRVVELMARKLSGYQKIRSQCVSTYIVRV